MGGSGERGGVVWGSGEEREAVRENTVSSFLTGGRGEGGGGQASWMIQTRMSRRDAMNGDGGASGVVNAGAVSSSSSSPLPKSDSIKSSLSSSSSSSSCSASERFGLMEGTGCGWYVVVRSGGTVGGGGGGGGGGGAA